MAAAGISEIEKWKSLLLRSGAEAPPPYCHATRNITVTEIMLDLTRTLEKVAAWSGLASALVLIAFVALR